MNKIPVTIAKANKGTVAPLISTPIVFHKNLDWAEDATAFRTDDDVVVSLLL